MLLGCPLFDSRPFLMPNAIMTAEIDTSGLNNAIPKLVAFGRRTLRQQCVTSLEFVVSDAQRNTHYADIGNIDSKLQVDVIPTTKAGNPTKAKKPRHFKVTPQKVKPVAYGILITMSRFLPDSKFNRETGGKWALPKAMLPTGKGSLRDRNMIIQNLLQRMTLARHSSTHYIQHGWAAAIRILRSDPDHKGKRSITDQTKLNPLNGLNQNELGMAVVTPPGQDAVVATAMNNIGDESNAVLGAKHREAALEYGIQPLNAAVETERGKVIAKMDEYMIRGLKQDFGHL